jgi:hypothetical protein
VRGTPSATRIAEGSWLSAWQAEALNAKTWVDRQVQRRPEDGVLAGPAGTIAAG